MVLRLAPRHTDQVFAEIEKIVKDVLTMEKGSIEQLWPMK